MCISTTTFRCRLVLCDTGTRNADGSYQWRGARRLVLLALLTGIPGRFDQVSGATHSVAEASCRNNGDSRSPGAASLTRLRPLSAGMPSSTSDPVEGQSAPRERRYRGMHRSLMLLVGLIFATTMLSGCVIEAPGHYHGWGWHHGDR